MRTRVYMDVRVEVCLCVGLWMRGLLGICFE